jgi:Flp pilus assembly protein TadG
LVAQSKVITNTDMTNILNASSVILEPFDKTQLKVIVSGVTVDANSDAKVTWSDARNTDPMQIGATYPLPNDLKVANTFLVVAEGSYGYTPVVAHVLSGTILMKDRFYVMPRLTAKVCRPPQTAQNC